MNSIPLSPVDYIFTGIGSQPITFAFSYPNKFDPDALRSSLHETLNYFPIVRSRLNKISETDNKFLIAEDGLAVDVIESDLTFEESSRIEQYITPINSIEDEPLTKITLTQTPASSILAVSISHALVDGFSYFHFLSSWARICRGDRIIPPYLQRDVLSSNFKNSSKIISSEDIYNSCGLFYGDKRNKLQTGQSKHERRFISNEMIKAYLEEARQEHNVSCTENDVIAAYLWKTYLPMWHNVHDNPMTYLTCPLDFRRVMTDFPKNYFGCALCFATAAIDFNSLLNASLGDLALLIRNSISKIKDDYILNSLNTLENLRKQNGLAAMETIHLRHPQHGMIVTNLTRMPIHDLDFGFGVLADFLTYAEVLSSAAILPAENGVEILVAHPLKAR
ncbi:MAG TPA: acyltransferase [bacterium]